MCSVHCTIAILKKILLTVPLSYLLSLMLNHSPDVQILFNAMPLKFNCHDRTSKKTHCTAAAPYKNNKIITMRPEGEEKTIWRVDGTGSAAAEGAIASLVVQYNYTINLSLFPSTSTLQCIYRSLSFLTLRHRLNRMATQCHLHLL